eukprot:1183518-Rhodomonas_salina.6
MSIPGTAQHSSDCVGHSIRQYWTWHSGYIERVQHMRVPDIVLQDGWESIAHASTGNGTGRA